MASTESHFTTHGPCSTYVTGTNEVDYATFASNPTNYLKRPLFLYVFTAQNFGHQSFTLQSIVSQGCHFVANWCNTVPN